jgi:hypothetical protein
MTTYYTLLGNVRGPCGHQHRTLTGLARCAQQDAKGCAAGGGYSDRRPYKIQESEAIPLGGLPEMDTYTQILEDV